jgi:hypothetical protein
MATARQKSAARKNVRKAQMRARKRNLGAAQAARKRSPHAPH